MADRSRCCQRTGTDVGRVCASCAGVCAICGSPARLLRPAPVCGACARAPLFPCTLCGAPSTEPALCCARCVVLERDRDGCVGRRLGLTASNPDQKTA